MKFKQLQEGLRETGCTIVCEMITEKINVSEYKHYVIDLDRNKIESGWEYKEDAQDHHREDLPPNIRGKIVAKVTLKKHGLDPENDDDWLKVSDLKEAKIDWVYVTLSKDGRLIDQDGNDADPKWPSFGSSKEAREWLEKNDIRASVVDRKREGFGSWLTKTGRVGFRKVAKQASRSQKRKRAVA
jgi:hypothetical protein